MENYLTSGDLALIENRRGNYGYMDGCGCSCGYGYNRRDGMAATGIGLAAGLGGAALIGVAAVAFGLNQASKARAEGAMQANTLLTNNLNQLTQLAIAEKTSREAAILAERNSREGWQTAHAPSIRNYVDVQTGALAGANASSVSNAWAQAEANLLSSALLNRTQMCPQEVTLVSKQNCPCPTSCCNS